MVIFGCLSVHHESSKAVTNHLDGAGLSRLSVGAGTERWDREDGGLQAGM